MVKTAAGTPCGITERLGAHCQGATGCSTVIRGGPLVVTLRAASAADLKAIYAAPLRSNLGEPHWKRRRSLALQRLFPA
nr:MAG TPA: hypothetical protein [Caudoviricetes sp.]